MISKQFNEWYGSINEISGGRLTILKHAVKRFSDSNASQAAAALAYYAIFSLFPLLLVGIAGGSYFISTQRVYQNITQLVHSVIPVSTDLIDQNLRMVLEARGTVGIISILTLLWSASSVFTNLATNINRAWPKASRRNFLQNRLVGLSIIAGMSVLLILSVVLNGIFQLAPLPDNLTESSSSQKLWRVISDLGTWLMLFLAFLGLYRWIPTADVHWNATIGGALTASLGWKFATMGFTWYLRSGLGRYQVVYGSLGAIVALLFLIFIVAIITLFGAHIAAAIDLWEKNKISET